MPNENEPEDDNAVKTSVEAIKPGTFELYIKTKSEEFDLQFTTELLQQLGDQIYEAIDAQEDKEGKS